MSDFIRYIVECVKPFVDGNTYPKKAKVGEVFDVTEGQYDRLKQSGPFHWQLVEKRVPNPKKKRAKA